MTPKRARLHILPAVWPPGRRDNLPGRLRILIAQSNAPPLDVGNPEKAWALPGHWIGDEHDADADRIGRLVLFPSYFADRATFDGILERLGVKGDVTRFAAFGCKARHKSYEQSFKSYLVQMRFVTREALRDVFQVGTEADQLPEQPIKLGEAMWRFVKREKKRVEPDLEFVPDSLALKMGYIPPMIMPYGIPDVREGLGFGLLVENRHFGVYRIWSRLVMLTK